MYWNFGVGGIEKAPYHAFLRRAIGCRFNHAFLRKGGYVTYHAFLRTEDRIYFAHAFLGGSSGVKTSTIFS